MGDYSWGKDYDEEILNLMSYFYIGQRKGNTS